MRKIILASDIEEWCAAELPLRKDESAVIEISFTRRGREFDMTSADIVLSAVLPSGKKITADTYVRQYKNGKAYEKEANKSSDSLEVETEADKVKIKIGREAAAESGETELILYIKKKRKEYRLPLCCVVD